MALRGEHAQDVTEAVRGEILNMIDYHVGHYVHLKDIPLSKRRNIVIAFMFITYKTKPNGEYDKTKARLVADGSNQGVNTYDLISSSTIAMSSVFIVINIASYYKCHLGTFDVKGAFLHVKLTEGDPDIYIRIKSEVSEEWIKVDPDAIPFLQEDGSLLLKLDRFIYGLKQSPLKWEMDVTDTLLKLGYEQSSYDPCLFYKKKGRDFSILSLHVDDLLQAYTDVAYYIEVRDGLIAKYGQVTANERATSYLGMTIDREGCNSEIKVSQKGLTMDSIEVYEKHFHPVKESHTPAASDIFGKGMPADRMTLRELVKHCNNDKSSAYEKGDLAVTIATSEERSGEKSIDERSQRCSSVGEMTIEDTHERSQRCSSVGDMSISDRTLEGSRQLREACEKHQANQYRPSESIRGIRRETEAYEKSPAGPEDATGGMRRASAVSGRNKKRPREPSHSTSEVGGRKLKISPEDEKQSDDPQKEQSATEDERKKFLGLVMKLMYLARLTRPDILLAVTYLASRTHVVTKRDIVDLGRVTGYLKFTRNVSLKINCQDLQVVGSSDASHGVHGNGRGHTGFALGLGRNWSYVYCRSGKQNTGGTSSTDSEVIALSEAVKMAVWMRGLLSELSLTENKPILLYQDNKSCLKLHAPDTKAKRAKHLLCKIQYVRDYIRAGVLHLEWIETLELLADLLTKALQGQSFVKHAGKVLGLYPMNAQTMETSAQAQVTTAANEMELDDDNEAEDLDLMTMTMDEIDEVVYSLLYRDTLDDDYD